MDEVKWTVYEPGNPTPVTLTQNTSDAVGKHHYVTEKKISEGFNDTQKQLVNDFNSMRKMLIKHDLMNKKD